MHQANILDPIHGTLDPTIWDDPAAPRPTLKPQHSHWILKKLHDTFAEAGYQDSEAWLTSVLTGSLTTYQYSDDSDVDVNLFVNAAKFPEWSRAELTGIVVAHIDGTELPGTPHPMQVFVNPAGIGIHDKFRPGERSGYDLKTDRWVIPPEASRSHDVPREYNAEYVYALEQADKMDRLLRYEPDKAVMLWHQIHRRRRKDMQAGKGDYALSNIVYKFLANRGLMPEISNLTGEYIAKSASQVRWLTHPNDVWDAGLQGDHSGWYHPQHGLVIGSPSYHHADIAHEIDPENGWAGLENNGWHSVWVDGEEVREGMGGPGPSATAAAKLLGLHTYPERASWEEPWHFGSRNHHEWTPGNWGKGFLLNDNTPVTWNTDADDDDIAEQREEYAVEYGPEYLAAQAGSPHHSEIAMNSGLNYEPREYNPDSEWHTPVYITPQGEVHTLDDLWRQGGQDLSPFKQVGLQPRIQTEDWNFESKTAGILPRGPRQGARGARTSVTGKIHAYV